MMHTLSLRQRDDDKPASGQNTAIYLDGTPLHGVTDFSMRIEPRDVVRVKLELLVRFEKKPEAHNSLAEMLKEL